MRRNASRPDAENPEWTAEEMRAARPLLEALPKETVEAIRRYRGQRGPQKTPTKELISLRVDKDVVDAFRATGRGWHTRANEALRVYPRRPDCEARRRRVEQRERGRPLPRSGTRNPRASGFERDFGHGRGTTGLPRARPLRQRAAGRVHALIRVDRRRARSNQPAANPNAAATDTAGVIRSSTRAPGARWTFRRLDHG